MAKHQNSFYGCFGVMLGALWYHASGHSDKHLDFHKVKTVHLRCHPLHLLCTLLKRNCLEITKIPVTLSFILFHNKSGKDFLLFHTGKRKYFHKNSLLHRRSKLTVRSCMIQKPSKVFSALIGLSKRFFLHEFTKNLF
jgi:hypothetical protein